ncbi:Curli production assembly/transport component CsgG [Pandoraea terrae]|uniref:Curli production assembly/transport component CsgG n=1 Tax=Pandoraea terrae TaxID=1537710 RepID=A0A5E4W934_9BURK|nr:CsgG/HfaB family protein [Pandoraea terrae]VVE20379.1 Curli production assembly/transport component CsgG [Pandoraea terrae]
MNHPLHRRFRNAIALLALLLGIAGCSTVTPITKAELTPPTASNKELRRLPPPKGKIVVAVYNFRDQTGQFKQAPDSSFSTAVTQGAGSMLVKALLESKWFIPVERENMQDLLTERRVIRAIDPKELPAQNAPPLLPLLAAKVIFEGGVVGYEMNVRSGGAGVKYLGIGADTQYRMDQVTVNLRAVDVNSGRVLHSVMTTKTIFSYQADTSVFAFVRFKELLEAEVGFSQNEPAQLCLMDAIESAVGHLIVEGVREHTWLLENPDDANAPAFQSYSKAQLDRETSAIVPKLPTLTQSPADEGVARN